LGLKKIIIRHLNFTKKGHLKVIFNLCIV
jgi:hypothetical protein